MQAPRREPDGGLDPGTPGSRPGPKAGAKLLSHPGIPIYLFIHERQRAGECQRHRQREKQTPRREPDVGVDPGSPGSRPGLQAALNRCATGDALVLFF